MYKLLIVDDSDVQIQSVKNFIDWDTLSISKIRTAQDGAEGLEVFKEFSPDIIITDVVMPIMDGIEMTMEIRKLNPAVKFIYISCHEDFVYLNNAIKNDVLTYILKPIDEVSLTKGIEKAITAINSDKKYNTMSKLLDESLGVFRETFLHSMLYSKHIDENYMKSTLHNLGFDQFKHFLVAKIEIYVDEDRYIDAYHMLTTARNNLFEHSAGFIIVEKTNNLIAIFMDNDKQSNTFFAFVKDSLKKYTDNVANSHGARINIGLSKMHVSLYDAQIMLTQAIGALQNSVICDEGIYIYEDLESVQKDFDILELKDSISILIEKASSEGITDFLNRFYPENVYLTQNYIKTLCIATVTILQIMLIERNLDMKGLFGNSAIVWNKLDNLETISNTKQWLYNILAASMEFINHDEKDRYEKIVSNIIENINRDYNTICNIEQVVENMYISTSYARRIFKKYTSKTIFEFLLSKRMQEAKKLLSDPYMKVYEVASLVGYSSKTHFAETFKRYTGQTPKDFQQNIKEG